MVSLYDYPEKVVGPGLVQWSHDANNSSSFNLFASSFLIGGSFSKVFLGYSIATGTLVTIFGLHTGKE
jgi:hypothetical protein